MSAASAPDSVDRFWVRPRPDRAGLRFDVLLALVMLVLTTFSVMQYYAIGMYPSRPSLWVVAGWLLLMTVTLAARRLQPEAVTLVIAAVFIIGAYQFVPEVLFSNIAMFIAMYSLGAWGRNRMRANITRGIIVVGMFAWLFSALLQTSGFYSINASVFKNAPADSWIPAPIASGLITIITNLLYFGGAWYFGDRAWASARDRCALETRTAELATERERVAEQAVTLERVRIARELHDVVAHHVSVMGVHAGAARRVLARDADKAAASLGIVEDNARSAIEELHRMLVALRQDEDDVASDGRADADPTRTASTRGVDQLSELVADACGAGLQVAFDVIGTPRPLTPTVDLIVYRVAQESLTNVRKHAGTGARVDLRLRYLADRVEVEVSDGGPAGAAAAAAQGSVRNGPGGLGQRGMRERVAAVGGSIEIGPKARGGYLVRASVPTGRAPVVPPVPMPVPLDASIPAPAPEETRA
ncbi:histidine kinase [Clavibacter michiganensis]|uniref:sensor histidine kinase n=1 Tax=Clavibacter michiganensis TaxID=28447 RepID=UPI000CE78815|nr:sensor histidine kinase [Clavibacter michiganensis]PPF90317.1 histidine kinase [Clavibacter michiganensis]PPF98325.1 histidine kinase [Clavibacter michiganensis]